MYLSIYLHSTYLDFGTMPTQSVTHVGTKSFTLTNTRNMPYSSISLPK